MDLETVQLVLAIGLSVETINIINSEMRITLRFRCAMARRNAKIMASSGYKVISFIKKIYFLKFFYVFSPFILPVE